MELVVRQSNILMTRHQRFELAMRSHRGRQIVWNRLIQKRLIASSGGVSG
jgi:hypothetical protein